jgi:hypothetical protein
VALDARLKLAVPAASDAATEHGEAAPQPAGAA